MVCPKLFLAKPTNVYILYEMPETITTGPSGIIVHEYTH